MIRMAEELPNWYLMGENNRPCFNSGNEIDDFDAYTENGLDEILNETPLGVDIVLCKGKYNGSTGLFETELFTKGIIQGTSPETQAKGNQRQLLARLNTISDYKYVKVENKIWLIMTMPTNNHLYEKVVLLLCNYVAKWQDSNKTIIYQPFVVQNASQYNSGEEGNKTLTIGYDQLLVYTSMDNDTKKLNRTKRMFIDYNTDEPTPYRITRIDTVSFSYTEDRVVCLVMTEDQYNPETDNIPLMLCDYTTPPSVSTDIVYLNEPTIRNGGVKSFSIVTDEIITWSIDCEASLNSYLQLTVIDNTHCKVKCVSNDNNISKKFNVKAKGTTVDSVVEITITGGL